MLTFYKYHGAGNDFVVIDNRLNLFDKTDIKLVKKICHRRFGVGADGILLLENSKVLSQTTCHSEASNAEESFGINGKILLRQLADQDDKNNEIRSEAYDFEMVYINSDGSYGAMCGNGGRCIVAFADSLGILKDLKNINFKVVDTVYQAQIINGQVRLKMQDVSAITQRNGLPFLYSGSTPHQVIMVKDLDTFPVVEQGRKIRYGDKDLRGVNVNYVEQKDGLFQVRTYERGVEDETLACGTGATSVAIYLASQNLLKENKATIVMPGGTLKVSFERNSNGSYENIWLEGPVVCVYEGRV